MSNKIVSLSINKKFGILEVQKVNFEEKEGLIVLKAEVGSGKTTVSNALNIGLSGGSEREVSDIDLKKYPEGFDIEECVSFGDKPVYLHTKMESGQLSSTLFIKDADGKKNTSPVVNGKKLTPAVLRDLLRTSLTFNVSEFISEDPRIQIGWMMKTFKDKLKEKGVVFDKKASDYQGSILYDLEQAKLDRSRIYNKVAELNAYKTRLEQEGNAETAIPDYVDIPLIEKEQKDAVAKYYSDLSNIDKKISELQVKAADLNAIIRGYNESLDNEKLIADNAKKEEVRLFNERVDVESEKRKRIKDAYDLLIANGAPEGVLKAWFESLPVLQQKKDFIQSEPLSKVEMNEQGKYVFREGLPEKVNNAFKSLDSLRGDVSVLLLEKESVKSPNDDYSIRIDNAKRTNRIAERWATFFEHQAADKKVKDIFTKYKKIFTEIDLGVDGLRMEIVGDEEGTEIRTTYNGKHDPKFFGNENVEYRNIASYSLTQKNVLSILMQVHLLEENKDGLRFLFLESPFDTKTKNIILEMQKKHDLQIIVTQTADVDVENIKEGEIVINNGYLLSSKL